MMFVMLPMSADGPARITAAAAVRVFVADDHEIVRRGLCDVIGRYDGIEVVGEAADARSAEQGVLSSRPDVAVLDVRLGDGDGIELCRSLAVAAPEVRCLILTSFVDRTTVGRAAAGGAAGFLLKTARSGLLINAILRIAAGELLIGEAPVVEVTDQPPGPLSPLNQREEAILELITDGLTNQQIAIELNLSAKTVANNLSALFVKLGMQRRTQAAAYGARLRRERRERS